MKILNDLHHRSHAHLLSLGLALLCLLAGLDYVSGSEISFSIFYLIPGSIQ